MRLSLSKSFMYFQQITNKMTYIAVFTEKLLPIREMNKM